MQDYRPTVEPDPIDPPRDTATVSLTGPVANVSEGDWVAITVTLSHKVAADTTVSWSINPVTANHDDYRTNATPTVTFPANSAPGTSRQISIVVVEDMLSETTESFAVVLRTITGDLAHLVSIDGTAASATVRIEESDPMRLRLTGPATVDEGDQATYTISIQPTGVLPTAAINVDFAAGSGTATLGADYAIDAGVLTFTQSQPGSQAVRVQTLIDNAQENDETFIFALSDPRGGGGPAPILEGNAAITTTIRENEALVLAGAANDDDNNSPVFKDGANTTRHVDENTAAGTNVGDPVAARDSDGDTLTYSINQIGATDFVMEGSSGQLATLSALDFEAQPTYELTVYVQDRQGGRDSIEVNIWVTNVEELGSLTLSPNDAPVVGEEIVSTLSDPDGSVAGETWQWQQTSDGGIWEDIDGATGPILVPGPQDAGKRLRLSVIYDDGFAAGVVLISAPTGIVINPNPTPTPAITPAVMPTVRATPVAPAQFPTAVASRTEPTSTPEPTAVAPFPTVKPTPPAGPGSIPSPTPRPSPATSDSTNWILAAVDRFIGLPAWALAGIAVAGALVLGIAGVVTWRIIRGRSVGASSPDAGDGQEAGSET